MKSITTHVLDTARGKPAEGVPIVLEIRSGLSHDGPWREVGRGATDADGRLRTLLPEGQALEAATYRLVFDTAAYFHSLGVEGFYPEASIVFAVRDATQHYHVPLLLSPYGYSTYRGS
jgi:5-hydroxyisourate hydrolase